MKTLRGIAWSILFLPLFFLCAPNNLLAATQLNVSVSNDNLYIHGCILQLSGNLGYKAYVNGVEVFTTGTFGGYPCFNGDLFLPQASEFIAVYAGSGVPAQLSFDFYTSVDFTQPITAHLHVYYNGTEFTDFPTYAQTGTDGSQQIGSSFNLLIQTLGTGLTGTLQRIDVRTSNIVAEYYGSRPVLTLYECDDETYGGGQFNGSGCASVFSGHSQDMSTLLPRVQAFYPTPITLHPDKYYYFVTQGNNQFQALPLYYGNVADTVPGACLHYRTSATVQVVPCDTVADLYFELHGITSLLLPPPPPPPPVPTGNSNVLFLPGLEASRLYVEKTVLGLPVEDQLWEPNRNTDVEDLYLDANGVSLNSAIYTQDVIDESNTPTPSGLVGQNIYKSFLDMLEEMVDDGDIAKWRAFAYDWRMSPQDVVDTPQKYPGGHEISLVTTVQELASSSDNGKVTIVAHSNGGLVAKALLKKLSDDKAAGISNLIDSVDVLILVASPQLGTPVAIPALLHGYDQRIAFGWLMDEVHARELGRNMPGGYGLLPSEKYMQETEFAPVTFTDAGFTSGLIGPLVSAYGSTTDSFAELQSFLSGQEGRPQPAVADILAPIKLSTGLLAEADALHDAIDNWTPPETLRVIQIAGWGIDTLAGFEYVPKFECVAATGGGSGCTPQYILDPRPIFTADGDKTVVTPSALGMEGEKWWVDLPKHNRELRRLRRNRIHKDMLEIEEIIDHIKLSLKKETPILNNILTNVVPIDSENRLRLSVHSPVTLEAYDMDGNHTGKVCPSTSDFCYIEENIPNSSYMEFGKGKYLNVPEDQLKNVKLMGTGIGTFTYESEKVLPDGTAIKTSYTDIPVTSQTIAEVTQNTATGQPELKVDVNGDGTNDITVQPQSDFNPVVYLQIMKATINSLDLDQKKKDNLSKRVDKLITQIQKGKIEKAKEKVKSMSQSLEKKLARPVPRNPKPGKLSKTDAQLLYDMLNQLLDNLN